MPHTFEYDEYIRIEKDLVTKAAHKGRSNPVTVFLSLMITHEEIFYLCTMKNTLFLVVND